MAYSGFNQRAYKYLPDANEQLQAYLNNFPSSKGWNQGYVDQLNQWVQSVNDLNSHWYGDDVEQFWKDIAVGFMPAVNRITGNNPSLLPNVDAVNLVLGGAQEVAQAEEEAAGISGVINVAQEQLEEVAQRQGERNEQWAKIAPFALPVFGLAALWVVVKAVK